MSKDIMWTQADAKGFEAECLFNEDSRVYEVIVCCPDAKHSRSENFPAHAEPVPEMDEADRVHSMRVAERLIRDVEHELGDF
ncbi:MAG TPA: hypothetical protein VD978_09975 [Azospirillum sp.]|nr:hypothetical protein [Azospirillum sp.]